MADFWITQVNRIVTAINKVNTSVQKLGDYISANTYALGTASVIETVAVSAILASTKIIRTLIGSAASVATIVGALNVATKLRGSITSVITISGILTGIFTMRSSVDGISGADSTLRDTTGLLCIGSVTGEGSTVAVIDSQPGLVGSVAAVGQCGAHLTGIA